MQAHARRLGNVGKYGAEITYQHESSIDYDEVSKLLHKVNSQHLIKIFLHNQGGRRQAISFLKVDWPPRRQSKLQKAVENSFFLATLRAQHDSEDQELIGFARIGATKSKTHLSKSACFCMLKAAFAPEKITSPQTCPCRSMAVHLD